MYLGVGKYFNCFDESLIGLVFILFLLPIILVIAFINSYQKYCLLKSFINKKNIGQIEEIEQEVNKSLLKYSDWVLTEKYIFYLEKLKIIKYSDIILIEIGIKLKISSGRTNSFGEKVTIYLKNGIKYTLNIPFIDDIYLERFVEIIKYRNPNIFIGRKNKYKEQIKKELNIDI